MLSTKCTRVEVFSLVRSIVFNLSILVSFTHNDVLLSIGVSREVIGAEKSIGQQKKMERQVVPMHHLRKAENFGVCFSPAFKQ